MGFIILLILAGILLILAELLIIPGVGVAGIFGVVCLGGASYYAFTVSTAAGFLVTALVVALMAVAIVYALNGKTWKRFELNEVIDSKGVHKAEIEKGMAGKAVTRLAPMGTARIAEQSCEVTSIDGMLNAGSDIEVVRVENNKIYVKQIKL